MPRQRRFGLIKSFHDWSGPRLDKFLRPNLVDKIFNLFVVNQKKPKFKAGR